MGTEYARTTPVIDSIFVTAGDTSSFVVEHIASSLSITTDLEINLRQKPGQELSFISFVDGSYETQVTIDASFLICDASYELTLESFNSLSSVQTTLKTDVVMIKIDLQPYLANKESLIDDSPFVIELPKGKDSTTLSYADYYSYVANDIFKLDSDGNYCSDTLVV